ncbi:MAG: Scd6-like Sm domain-containing protein [Benjaminiella poitrasii]|nr:MAG: Scd6-like Sm domain-containing protein [Benjaminiella poitrasii]
MFNPYEEKIDKLQSCEQLHLMALLDVTTAADVSANKDVDVEVDVDMNANTSSEIDLSALKILMKSDCDNIHNRNTYFPDYKCKMRLKSPHVRIITIQISILILYFSLPPLPPSFFLIFNKNECGICPDSKISLISLSDIRYIGNLHYIDSVNATVALRNIRSFGTEGRKGHNPKEEIEPSDNVFDYVVFHIKDLKYLTVLEAPPSWSEFTCNNMLFSNAGYSVQQNYYAYPTHIMLPFHENGSVIYPPSDNGNANTAVKIQEEEQEETFRFITQDSTFHTEKKKDRKITSVNQFSIKKELAEINDNDENQMLNSLLEQVNNLEITEAPQQSQQKSNAKKKKVEDTSIETNESNDHPQQHRRPRYRPRRRRRNRQSSNSITAISKVDFDFASANAKFDKEGDFVDDIACDSKEGYQKGRTHYQQENKTNLETFGEIIVKSQPKRRHRNNTLTNKDPVQQRQQKGKQ